MTWTERVPPRPTWTCSHWVVGSTCHWQRCGGDKPFGSGEIRAGGHRRQRHQRVFSADVSGGAAGKHYRRVRTICRSFQTLTRISHALCFRWFPGLSGSVHSTDFPRKIAADVSCRDYRADCAAEGGGFRFFKRTLASVSAAFFGCRWRRTLYELRRSLLRG